MGRAILVFPKVMPDYAGAGSWTLLPLPLLAIAAPALEDGHEVEVIDQRTDLAWASRLRDSLAAGGVTCVGVSVMSGFPIRGALEASELVHRTSPGVPVVWGGVHPTLMPAQTLHSPWVDIVVRGEGERAFAGLLSALECGEEASTVPGVALLRDGGMVGTPPAPALDLESLPRPAYDLVDVSLYLNAPFHTDERPLALATSRGCPSACLYCYNRAFNSCRWRGLAADSAMREIAHLRETYGVDSFFLLDDNFFANPVRVHRICALVAENAPGVTFLNANCRVDTLDGYADEDLEALRRAGFQKLFIGVESGADTVLAAIHKGIRVEQVLRVNGRLKRAGIVPVYSFMVGFPGETEADMDATLRLMSRLIEEYPEAVVNPANIFSPFPGTPLYDRAVASGMPEPADLEEWSRLDYVAINYTAGRTPDQVAATRRAFLLSNLVDGKSYRGGVRGAIRRAYASRLRHRILARRSLPTAEMRWLERRRAALDAAVGAGSGELEGGVDGTG